LLGVGGVVGGGVEVDDGVAAPGGAADEGVVGGAAVFAGLGPAVVGFERGEGGAEEFDAVLVGGGDDLGEGGGELGAGGWVGVVDVVDGVVGEDDPFDVGLL
jgi:hypothetical protein